MLMTGGLGTRQLRHFLWTMDRAMCVSPATRIAKGKEGTMAILCQKFMSKKTNSVFKKWAVFSKIFQKRFYSWKIIVFERWIPLSLSKCLPYCLKHWLCTCHSQIRPFPLQSHCQLFQKMLSFFQFLKLSPRNSFIIPHNQ